MKKSGIIALLLITILASCQLLDLCLTGNGNLITEYRAVSDYDYIVNTTGIDVTIIEADTFGLLLDIEENLAENIVTSVSNGTLEIRHRNKGCINYTRTPSVIVSAPSVRGIKVSGSGDINSPFLSGHNVSVRVSGSGNSIVGEIESSTLQITISGSGDVSVNNLNCDEVEVVISGSGDLSSAGTSGHGIFKLSGSGDAYFREVPVNTAAATISGSGNLHVNVSEAINAILSGSGNIFLTGNPSVHANITGSGKIISN